MFAIATLVISVYLSVEYYSVSTIVLDPGTEQYSVYRGDMLTATQHCHNIYIRLMSKKPGEMEGLFYGHHRIFLECLGNSEIHNIIIRGKYHYTRYTQRDST